MGTFTEKQLYGLQDRYETNLKVMRDAEKDMEAAGSDPYAYAEAAEPETANVCLANSYSMAEARAAQQQNAPRPISDGEQLQRDVWQQIEVQPGQPNRWLEQIHDNEMEGGRSSYARPTYQ